MKQKDLEKTALGVAVMFGLFWIYTIFVSQHLPFQRLIKGVLGLAILYGAGLGLFILITEDVSKEPYAQKGNGRVSAKTVLFCFLLQCSAFAVINVLTIASSVLGGAAPSSEAMPMSAPALVLLLIFNPVVEEFVFRHLFASRLLKHGERFYILASAYCFAVLHGASVGLVHIVYTFILGLIWAYLTVKSGSPLLAVLMHAVSNLFNAVIIQLLSSQLMALAVYSLAIMALGVVGIVLYIKNRKKLVLDGSSGLMDKQAVKDVFTNRGVLIYTAVIFAIMLLKLAVKQ